MVTDKQLDNAWGNANFGESVTKRNLVKYTLLKCASGYYTGKTAKSIVEELGLVKEAKWELTKKGKEYLYEAFASGISI